MSSDLFDQLHIFKNLSPGDNELVRPLFKEYGGEQGTIIFEQGDLTDFLYLVVEGEVVVRYKPDDGPAITITRVGPEGVVGWSAALGSPAYTSGAVCTTQCKMLRVHGADLRRLCEEHAETGSAVLEQLAAIIARRLSNTHPHVIAMLEQGLRNHGPVVVHHS